MLEATQQTNEEEDSDDGRKKNRQKKIRQFSRKILIRHKSSNMCITNEFRLYGCKNTFFRRLHARCLLSLFIGHVLFFLVIAIYVWFLWFDKKLSYFWRTFKKWEMLEATQQTNKEEDSDDGRKKNRQKKSAPFSRKILIRHKSSNMCITNEFRLYGCKNTFFKMFACVLLIEFIYCLLGMFYSS